MTTTFYHRIDRLYMQESISPIEQTEEGIPGAELEDLLSWDSGSNTSEEFQTIREAKEPSMHDNTL